MAHVIGAGDRGQWLAVRAATERLTLLVGGQLRVPAEVYPAGLRAGASLAGAGEAVRSRSTPPQLHTPSRSHIPNDSPAPVPVSHQQHIAGGAPGEYLAQLCAVGLGAARDVTVDVDRACGGQCRDLRRDALARLWRRAHSRRSCSYSAPIFRTMEGQSNQPHIFCAKLMIFAHYAEALHAKVHPDRGSRVRGKPRSSVSWNWMASVSSRRRRRISLPCGRRGAWLNRGRIPRSSMRLLHCKGRGRFVRRARRARSSFMIGRPSARLPSRSTWDTRSPLRCRVNCRRLETETIYQKQVFFIQHLGFITPTAARQISLEEALRFERVHKETYRNHGFELVPIAPGSLLEHFGGDQQPVTLSG